MVINFWLSNPTFCKRFQETFTRKRQETESDQTKGFCSTSWTLFTTNTDNISQQKFPVLQFQVFLQTPSNHLHLGLQKRTSNIRVNIITARSATLLSNSAAQLISQSQVYLGNRQQHLEVWERRKNRGWEKIQISQTLIFRSVSTQLLHSICPFRM